MVARRSNYISAQIDAVIIFPRKFLYKEFSDSIGVPLRSTIISAKILYSEFRDAAAVLYSEFRHSAAVPLRSTIYFCRNFVQRAP
jgi:hypothetical protein